MEIKLYGKTNEGEKYAIIDEDDYDLIKRYKWYLHLGYASTTFHKKGKSRIDIDRNVNILMHRLIMNFPECQIDHKNRIKLDNRKSNLRTCRPMDNACNKAKYEIPFPKSQYKGVGKRGNRWSAKLCRKHLGTFISEKEAAQAYDKAARYYFGEYAFLNFPLIFFDKPVRFVDFIPEQKKLTSEYIGVSWFSAKAKRIKRWRATYKGKHIGFFLTEEEAALAYQEAFNAN